LVGWSMSAGMTAQLVDRRSGDAIWRRASPMPCCTTPIAAANTAASSSAADGRSRRHLFDERSGNVWDNAAMESFFSSLKTERTARKRIGREMRQEPTCSITFERFYNAKRRHSTIGYLSPMEFETKAGLA